jgi:hypothetical protein
MLKLSTSFTVLETGGAGGHRGGAAHPHAGLDEQQQQQQQQLRVTILSISVTILSISVVILWIRIAQASLTVSFLVETSYPNLAGALAVGT